MITNSQRTIYGLEMQAAHLIEQLHTIRPNTTLNEKFSLFENEAIGSDPADDQDFAIRYLALGVGGQSVADGTNSYSYSQHSPLDAALFEHIPFIMREVTNDLSSVEQEKYRFKVAVTIDNVDYYQYFLRKIDMVNDFTTNTYKIIPGTTGTANLIELTTNTSAHLNPVPRTTSYNSVEESVFVSKAVKLKFSLTPTELTEISNAIDIIFGAAAVKPLTEIGICGGLDKQIGGKTEAIMTQIYHFVGVDIDTRIHYDPIIGYVRAIELGGTEPIYA